MPRPHLRFQLARVFDRAIVDDRGPLYDLDGFLQTDGLAVAQVLGDGTKLEISLLGERPVLPYQFSFALGHTAATLRRAAQTRVNLPFYPSPFP